MITTSTDSPAAAPAVDVAAAIATAYFDARFPDL